MKWADLASSPEFADLWRRWLQINIASVTETTGAPSSGKGGAGERRQDLGCLATLSRFQDQQHQQHLGPTPDLQNPNLHVRPTSYLQVWRLYWSLEWLGRVVYSLSSGIRRPSSNHWASHQLWGLGRVIIFMNMPVSTPKKWGSWSMLNT